MKFKVHKKGKITSPFSDDSGYRPHIHTGVDWVIGYDKPVQTDNAGTVSHIDTNGSDGWRAVWLLVPYKGHFMEVCLGHLKDIYVDKGQKVAEDEVVGSEGNFGLVFQGGVQITPKMREAGDRRGSHIHEQYRPVKLVSRKTKGKHYRHYKFEGKWLEIIHTNNTRGCIDPMQFEARKVILLQQIIILYKKLLHRLSTGV